MACPNYVHLLEHFVLTSYMISGARGPMEVRPLVKTRCYIRDSRPVSPAARTQPEPLAELLGRVSKHPRPLSLVGEQGAKQGTAAAFSNEYRSSSRYSQFQYSLPFSWFPNVFQCM